MRNINRKLVVLTAILVVFAGACSLETADRVAVPPPANQVEPANPTPDPVVEMKEEDRRQAGDAAYMAASAPKMMDQAVAYEAQPLSGLARLRAPAEPVNRENYARFTDNPLQRDA